MASLTDRMIRAAKLDVTLYEEVETDKGAMGQAMGVVILSSVAAGIGTIGTDRDKGTFFRNHSCPAGMVYLGVSDIFYWNQAVT